MRLNRKAMYALLSGGVLFQAAATGGCFEQLAPALASFIVQYGLSALLGGIGLGV